jgi:hypothetical protein
MGFLNQSIHDYSGVIIRAMNLPIAIHRSAPRDPGMSCVFSPSLGDCGTAGHNRPVSGGMSICLRSRELYHPMAATSQDTVAGVS